MIGQRYVSPPKHGVQPTFVSGRADAEHVCRAWRVTMPVGVRLIWSPKNGRHEV